MQFDWLLVRQSKYDIRNSRLPPPFAPYFSHSLPRSFWKRLLRRLEKMHFARKFSNINFFSEILPLKDDELVMSEL